MSYADLILQHRPHGFWLLDEKAGTTARGLTVAGDATYSGSGVTYQVRGPSAHIPKGVALDGTAGSVALAGLNSYLSTNGQQSFEVWLNVSIDLTASSGARTVLGGSLATNQSLMLGGDATGVLTNEVSTVLNDAGGANDRTGWSGFTIPAGWHHHAWTYLGQQDTWNYYLDGSHIGLYNGSAKISNGGGAFGLTGAGTPTWYIGRVITFFSALAGVACPATYSYMLSGARVLEHYIAGKHGRSVP